jgi:signal transduction histidine kinase
MESSNSQKIGSSTELGQIDVDLTHHPVPLDSVITTQELFNRESRYPDYDSEVRALGSLMEVMSETPGIILQRLVDSTLQLCRAHSAGVSLLEYDEGASVFRWRATAGAWSRFAGGTMPRGASPCGTVLDRNASLLFSRPGLHFDLPKELDPDVVEALLVPFRVRGNAVGTIWVVSHDESRKFDAEDWRLLASFARFASNAYQILGGISELEAANNSKIEFLAGMSHDARTPLNAITGYVELLELGVHGSINDEQQNALRRVRQNTEFLVNLVDDVLSFARLEAGTITIEVTDVDADAVLDSVKAVCDAATKDRGIVLVRSPSTQSEPIRADPQRLTQILLNLIEHSTMRPPGGGEIALSYSVDHAEGRGYITIRDPAVEMSPEFMSRIFDPFVTGEHSTEHRDGTGLSLAISRKLTREMNGDITVSAKPGEGSAFTVSLPLSGLWNRGHAA